MSSDNFIPVPKFDGNVSYDEWRLQFMFLLKFKQCQIVVEKDERPAAIKEEDWEHKSNKAMYFLSLAVKPDKLVDCDTPKKVIDKLDKLYLRKSESKQLLIEKQLSNLKLLDGDDPEQFFEKFERKIIELHHAGGDTSRRRKLSYLMMSLPDSCRHIIETIDLLPEEGRTVDYVREKLLQRKQIGAVDSELVQTSEKAENNSQVFKTQVSTHNRSNRDQRSDGATKSCFTCGKPGHISRDCRSNFNGNPRNNFGNLRGNFGQRGNFSNQRGNFRGNYNNRGWYRGSNRGRGNFDNNRSYAGNTEINNNSHDIDTFHISVNNCNSESVAHKGEVEWLVDSGCTDHVINSDQHFYEFIDLKRAASVKLGDDNVVKATKVGNIICKFYSKCGERTIRVKNVFYVPDLQKNLLSVSSMTRGGKCIIFNKDYCEIFDNKNELMIKINEVNKLYPIQSKIIEESNVISANYIKNKMSDKERFHRILGHVNFKDLNYMCRHNYLDGLPNFVEQTYMDCEICIQSKMHNLKYENNRTRAEYCGQIIHSDVKFLDVESFNGEKYFVSFIDDYSRIARIYCIKNKSEVFDKFMEYFNYISNIIDRPVQLLRCDNGTEYLNNRFYSFAKEKGFKIAPCTSYNHELNGVAERYNRTIMDRVRCLRKESNLDRKYWPELVYAACYIGNRLLNSSTFERKTPYEIFLRKKPSIKNLKMYGSDVFVRVPDVKRTTQDDKAVKGKLVGYFDLGYKVLVDGKVVLARNVKVIDGSEYVIVSDKEDSKNKNEDKENEVSENESESTDEGSSKENEECKKVPVRMSSREKKAPSKFDDYVLYANFVQSCAPVTYEEAVRSDNCEQWRRAMKKEFDALNETETWELVERCEDQEVISVKWLYTLKPGGRYKARLVARGFQQSDTFEEIYAPVAKLSTLKSLLAICCSRGYHVHQMDVQTAFLNSAIRSEIYVEQPKGCIKEKEKNKVYRLKKSLYGLKESSRNWYNCFSDFILSLNFKRSLYDSCLYFNNESDIYCIIFVDDILICGEDIKKVENIKVQFKERFKMTDMGNVNSYLGIQINYNKKKRIMALSQSKYIESLAKKFKVNNSNVKYTPMEQNLKLQPGELNENINYRNLIGALLYVSICTRPDISFSINYLSRFQACCDETHYKHAERVLIYLYHTRNMALTFNINNVENLIDCFVDSDWASDVVDSKSTTGIIIRILGNPVFWKTIKQKTVSRSSTHAEYYALADAAEEILFIKGILSDFNVDDAHLCKIKIFEDNSGALALAKNGNFTKRSKHIDVALHFVHDLVIEGMIDVIKVDGVENIADMLTKPLGRVKFTEFREKLNVC